MTVAELLERISSEELSEWMEFYRLEPFGTEAEMLGHAITSSVVANANRGRGDREYKPADFMPKFERQEQSVDEMVQFAAMYTAAMGGQDLRDVEEPD